MTWSMQKSHEMLAFIQWVHAVFPAHPSANPKPSGPAADLRRVELLFPFCWQDVWQLMRREGGQRAANHHLRRFPRIIAIFCSAALSCWLCTGLLLCCVVNCTYEACRVERSRNHRQTCTFSPECFHSYILYQ